MASVTKASRSSMAASLWAPSVPSVDLSLAACSTRSSILLSLLSTSLLLSVKVVSTRSSRLAWYPKCSANATIAFRIDAVTLYQSFAPTRTSLSGRDVANGSGCCCCWLAASGLSTTPPLLMVCSVRRVDTRSLKWTPR